MRQKGVKKGVNTPEGQASKPKDRRGNLTEDELYELDYPEVWRKNHPGEEFPTKLVERLRKKGVLA